MLSRRGLLGATALTLLAAVARADLRPVPRIARAVFPGVVFAGDPASGLIALTIDDGPEPSTTPGILAALDAVGIHATFFMVGERAEAAPEIVREIVARGHEIGHHMDRDEMTARLSEEALERGMAETLAFLETFAQVRFLRPGWGLPTRRIVAAAERHGLTVVVGNVAPMDTSSALTPMAEDWLRLNARAGAILTLHDGPKRGRTAARLIGQIVPKIEERGLGFATVSQLVDA